MVPELYPLPIATLAGRLVREIDAGGPIYGLPRAAVWTPDPTRDLSCTHFGERMATPLGPASGPHTQLAQNIVLCWLGGARFVELKTVQVLDELRIPRPCIHVPHAGWNVEWSQELRVEESAREYVKAWYLVHLAARRLGLPVDTVFDMSLGYDLAGVSGEKIAGFVATLADATKVLDALRAELPPELRIDVPARISRSVTLSTFHGCPADQIEAIAACCMERHGLHTIVKLNPTLLGLDGVARILHDRLGYTRVRLDPRAFEKDLRWEQLLDMVPRLSRRAAVCGVGFGVKFTNTLVCRSSDAPFGDGEVYLSGPPLHALAMTLAARFMATFPGIPVSFSAGVDATNFPDVVATGIRPVTTCTDLLKGKGYAKLCAYLRGLERRMPCDRLADYAVADPAAYAEAVAGDPRYRDGAGPKKVGSRLALLDCLTCDKCVPVCPNAAIFVFDLPDLDGGRVCWGERVEVTTGPPVKVTRRHQIAILADACNQCGQCDVICPEDGGPFATKPVLFLDARAWDDHPGRDGFRFDGDALLWRRRGAVMRWERDTVTVAGGTLTFRDGAPVASTGAGAVALADVALLRHLVTGLRTAWSA
ncbi:MAG: glutamate synthase [Myxococcota bacterium]